MKEYRVMDNVYLFNSYIDAIDLSFNQFLVLTPIPMLIHTGAIDRTEVLLPKIKEVLGSRPLEYVFISHFESDECGGLALLKNHYPEIKAVCSQITARQLMGFGITDNIAVVNPQDKMKIGDSLFEFISYPSEMHLWEGLMVVETNKGILYSSDIFIRTGKIQNAMEDSKIFEEIQNINLQKVPSQEALERLKNDISALKLNYLMPGHGPCLKLI